MARGAPAEAVQASLYLWAGVGRRRLSNDGGELHKAVLGPPPHPYRSVTSQMRDKASACGPAEAPAINARARARLLEFSAEMGAGVCCSHSDHAPTTMASNRERMVWEVSPTRVSCLATHTSAP